MYLHQIFRSNAAVDAEIEKIAQESIVCMSCKTGLYGRTDTLVWEAMEFCSDKCLRNLTFNF